MPGLQPEKNWIRANLRAWGLGVVRDWIRANLRAVGLGVVRARHGEVGAYRFAHGIVPANRTAVINHIAVKIPNARYLEIGVRNLSDNFDKIAAWTKVSVDPDPNARADVQATSDKFFESNRGEFDIIFIDGFHEYKQVLKDIQNSLESLSEGGTILCHDVNPPGAFEAREEQVVDGEYPVWCGTTWKAFAELRATRRDLEMCVIDTDYGVGVIRRGNQETHACRWEDFANFSENRESILNLISVREFIKRF